jgi:hypothetical protein
MEAGLNLDDLVAFLKKVRSPLAIRAYIFRGRRLRISKGLRMAAAVLRMRAGAGYQK